MIDQPTTINNDINTVIQPVTEQCIMQTAERFDLPDIILRAILKVEAGKPGELRVNKNGTYDIGPMQVNSIWLPKFAEYINNDDILYNGCANLQVGAWILRYNINKSRGDLWQGIGNYHSNSTVNHYKYRDKIQTAVQSLKTKLS